MVRVAVRPVMAVEGTLRADRQFASRRWFDGDRRFRFVVVDRVKPDGVDEQSAVATFGPPVETGDIGTYRVLVWDRNLSVRSRPSGRRSLSGRHPGGEDLIQGGLVEDGHAQRLGLGELGAGVGARHHVGRLLRDAAGHLGAQRFEGRAGLLPGEAGQAAGEDEGQPGQRQVAPPAAAAGRAGPSG